MRIASAERRLFWKTLALGMAFDFVLAASAVWLFADRNEWLWGGFVLWAIVQAAGIMLSLIGFLHVLLAWRLGAFDTARRAFLDALRENNLPKPQPYELSVDDYLTVAAMAEANEPKVRVAAATLLGVRSGIKGGSGVMRMLLINRAHEKALEEYAER